MDDILFYAFILAAVFSIIASIGVKLTFHRYNRVRSSSGRTAAEVARRILDAEGLSHVQIERVSGSLTDHYDPKAQVLRLSDSVYASDSAAAIGVAAHEAGHAIQHAERYLPIRVRSAIVPLTGFASRFSWILIVVGLVIEKLVYTEVPYGYYLVLGGIGLYAVTTLFQLVTLPCEFDASGRAMRQLRNMNFSDRDLKASRKVLTAAAMTYVAALATSVIQLLRLILIFGGRRRR